MEYEYYEDVIDAYEAGIGVEEGDSLTDYIRKNNIKIINIEPFRPTESKADGGSVGIEVLFGPKVPAAPSQLVSESDILLGYRGDAAYRSGSEQSKSIGQGNVGSKASFGGGKGRDRSGRDEGAGGAQVSRALEAQRLQNIANQNKSNATVDTLKNVYGIVSPFINPGSNLGKVKTIFDTYNLYKKGPFNEKDMTLGMGDNPLPSENLLAFEPGSKKDNKLKSLFKEKGLTEDLGIPFSPKKDKQLQELMKEDQEQTDFPKTQLLKAADGGRVGLFMGGPPLDGEALAIYNSMSAYGAGDQEIADRLQSLGYYTPGGSTPDTPDQGIINQQLNQGGGDGPKGDFGIFGNLLKDTAKDFNVQVYDEELGDFIDTKITGYKNVNSGLYQDKFGKNLQPAFSNKGQVFGLAGIVAQALGLTPDTVGGYVPGSIKGKYDGVTDMFSSLKNFRFKNPFNFFKSQQATNAEIAAANLKAKQELEAKLAAEAAAAALQQQMQDTGVTGSNYDQAANIAGGGGGNTATYGGQTAREATYDNDPSTGTSQGYSQHYARGGLATMFTRRR